MAETGVEKTGTAEARSVEYQRMPWTLRCAECRSDRHATENRVAGKYLQARPVPIATGLGFAKQRLRARGRNSQRIDASPARRSHISVTFCGIHLSASGMGGSDPAEIRRFFSTQTETEARPIT